MSDADLAIIGSGFGGSVMAMIARRLGYRVILLETISTIGGTISTISGAFGA
jgi:phytoene dehydrogenase-like protein